MITLSDLDRWMKEPEGEILEFKEAKSRYDFEKLTKYCCALANEGGGKIFLGITNTRPRSVVGSSAFEQIEKTRSGLIKRLQIRIEATELSHPNGRVVVFEIPSRPVGTAIEYEGQYWMRRGEDLVAMDSATLKLIFAEGQPDFTAEICVGATLDDLDRAAIDTFRNRWYQKSRREEILTAPVSQLLEDAELLSDGGITYAALLLVGSNKALGRHLAQAEIVFEYRSDESSIAYQDRKEFRAGFLLNHEQVWDTFNLRNQIHTVSDGLFRREIRAFNKDAVREGILNAFCHRNYRLEGSIFIRQFPNKVEIISPGGFPAEITPENIFFRQAPRNRRLAEACGKCNLVERSGQGVDLMFSASVREGKLPPDYSGTDAHHVMLTLHGKVQNPAFLQFLEKVAAETQKAFRVEDLIVLDAVHRGVSIPKGANASVTSLIDSGVIERVARKKLVLSRRFYSFVGKPGEYTRKKGLNSASKKALLQQHLKDHAGQKGCPLSEIMEIFPELSRAQVQVLLRGLKQKGLAHPVGIKRAARWFPGKANA